MKIARMIRRRSAIPRVLLWVSFSSCSERQTDVKRKTKRHIYFSYQHFFSRDFILTYCWRKKKEKMPKANKNVVCNKNSWWKRIIRHKEYFSFRSTAEWANAQLRRRRWKDPLAVCGWVSYRSEQLELQHCKIHEERSTWNLINVYTRPNSGWLLGNARRERITSSADADCSSRPILANDVLHRQRSRLLTNMYSEILTQNQRGRIITKRIS